jgi:streptomycin 6-kinase
VGAIEIPESLWWWRRREDGRAWLERLPRLADEVAAAWGITLGEPLAGGNASLVVAVTCADGRGAVLKLQFPDEESEREADALAAWDGQGAVRLLRHDAARRALLLERLRPGRRLWAVEDDAEATRVAASVMRELWRTPREGHGFRQLADVAREWLTELRSERAEVAADDIPVYDEAIEAIPWLIATGEESVLLHQDFHGGNVLSAERSPWLAIDPKPLAGERAFDVASLLRDRRERLVTAGGPALVQRRLNILADELGLDRERMRLWGIVHALAWAEGMPPMVHAARLIAMAG